MEGYTYNTDNSLLGPALGRIVSSSSSQHSLRKIELWNICLGQSGLEPLFAAIGTGQTWLESLTLYYINGFEDEEDKRLFSKNVVLPSILSSSVSLREFSVNENTDPQMNYKTMLEEKDMSIRAAVSFVQGRAAANQVVVA